MTQEPSKTKERKPILIIDTNAFIRCLDLARFAEKYDIYTTNNVLSEIRDKRAREKFLTITYDIHTGSVDTKTFNFVEDFSKRTGDFTSLSFPDKELIALAVLIAKNNGKGDSLRKEPPPLTEWIPPKQKDEDQPEDTQEGEENKSHAEVDDKGFVVVTKGTLQSVDEVQGKKNVIVINPDEHKDGTQKEAETKPETANENNTEEAPLQKIEDGQETQTKEENGEKADDEFSEDEEDNGKGWINPDNIAQKLYNAVKKQDRIAEMGVAIMTTDFAMQNVIIQIGIPLLSEEGYVIRQTRRFVLECYACKKICNIADKMFCPSCGNPTLTKLSVRVNDNGTMTFFKNPNKKVSQRGKIYSIPKSEGGRTSNQLLLREDELLMGGRVQQQQKIERGKEFQFKQRVKDYENGLTFDDITLKHKYTHQRVQFGYGKINPNDRNQFKKRK